MVAGLGDLDERHRSFIVCQEPAPTAEQLVRLAGDGWTVAADGHWPVLRRPGQSVRWLGSWGLSSRSPERVATLWAALESACARFAPGGRPIGAPATTGRDLWLRSIPAGREWACLPDDLQDTLRHTSGQGRMEVLRLNTEPITDLYEYDARLAYLGVLRALPIGEPVELRAAPGRRVEVEEYAPARYWVRFTAPRGWKGPGVLPHWAPEGPSWPVEGEGVADGSEVRLAVRAGWSVDVSRALVWPDVGDPFGPWLRRVEAAVSTFPKSPAWRAVWRSIALHTIGAMHGSPRKVTGFGATPPTGSTGQRMASDDGGVWRWTTTTAAAWPETHHPEWTSTVWSRARARLLDAPAGGGKVGGLHVDPEQLVGFRTDALYVRQRLDWPDDGGYGRFRVKRTLEGVQRPYPRSAKALGEMMGAEA